MAVKDLLDELHATQPHHTDVFGDAARDAIPGYIMEFGVASGETVNIMADRFRGQTVYGFDWWKGLPEYWRPEFPEGMFACPIPEVRPNVELVNGLFQDTLPAWLEANPGQVSFLHLDADLYSSTDFVLRQLEERIVPGTIILFDEILYWHESYIEHEYKAFIEFIDRTGFEVEYYGRRRPEAYAFRLR